MPSSRVRVILTSEDEVSSDDEGNLLLLRESRYESISPKRAAALKGQGKGGPATPSLPSRRSSEDESSSADEERTRVAGRGNFRLRRSLLSQDERDRADIAREAAAFLRSVRRHHFLQEVERVASLLIDQVISAETRAVARESHTAVYGRPRIQNKAAPRIHVPKSSGQPTAHEESGP